MFRELPTYTKILGRTYYCIGKAKFNKMDTE